MFDSTRIRVAIAVLAACAVALAAILVDAGRRRAARREEALMQAAVVDVAGVADLALSSSSRWLRHPSQAEPGAATSDLPSSLDVDPAGALIGPPRQVLEVGGVELR